MSSLNAVDIKLPSAGSTLRSNFQKLQLDSTPKEAVGGSSQQPGRTESSAESSPRIPTNVGVNSKRTANDAWSSEDVEEDAGAVDPSAPRERKRLISHKDKGKSKQDSESLERSTSRSGSGSGSGGEQGLSGSGSSSGTGSSHSTHGTSFSGGSTKEQMLSGLGIPMMPGSDVTGSPGVSHRLNPFSSSPGFSYTNPAFAAPLVGRMTYVNPNAQAGPSRFLPGVGVSVGSGGVGDFFRPPAYLSPVHIPQNINANPPPFTLVSFGAGMNSKDLDRVTANSEYGSYHIPCSAFPVGSGQFLTGGFGFLGRRYGLAMDNVVEVEMVLADGRVVWVGENGAHGGDWREGEDPNELWWAMRGAGVAFGVATRYRSKAYYIPTVYAGNFIL